MFSSSIKLKRLFIEQIILDIFLLTLLFTSNIIAFRILKNISQTEITVVSLFAVSDIVYASDFWDILIFFISIGFILYGIVRFPTFCFYPIYVCFGMCAFYTYTLLNIAYIFVSPVGCKIDTKNIKLCYSLWGVFLFSTLAILCIIYKMWKSREFDKILKAWNIFESSGGSGGS